MEHTLTRSAHSLVMSAFVDVFSEELLSQQRWREPLLFEETIFTISRNTTDLRNATRISQLTARLASPLRKEILQQLDNADPSPKQCVSMLWVFKPKTMLEESSSACSKKDLKQTEPKQVAVTVELNSHAQILTLWIWTMDWSMYNNTASYFSSECSLCYFVAHLLWFNKAINASLEIAA